jgi:hypothetical protein
LIIAAHELLVDSAPLPLPYCQIQAIPDLVIVIAIIIADIVIAKRNPFQSLLFYGRLSYAKICLGSSSSLDSFLFYQG